MCNLVVFFVNKTFLKRIAIVCCTSFIVLSSVSCSSSQQELNKASILEILEDNNKSTNALNANEKGEGTDDSNINSSGVTTTDAPETLTITQRNSINMLNYLTVLTQEINDSKESRVFLESAYSSLINNTYPNAVDTRTQSQLLNILDTLENYRMLTVKRERIEYVYEQNRAAALRKAIPNPIGLLSAVQSGSPLKIAASVLYMAVDSKNSYDSAIAQADMQYLQDGWELDDEEAKGVHNSRKNAFSYMLNMVRDNAFSGDYTLNEESVQSFVNWKNNTNNIRKITWLETNQRTYKDFGPYWLELASCYYNTGEYKKCLDAFGQYEAVTTRIFRKDYDYANAIPMAIFSAKEVMNKEEYITFADDYLEKIMSNTNEKDLTLRYYTALLYIDLCAVSDNKDYLYSAYKIALDNINTLVDEQKILNQEYLDTVRTVDVGEIKADKNADDEKKKKAKREKEEAKQYNKQLREERKVALPPVNESLYLNCDLLFSLVDQINISDKEKLKIDSILHGNNEKLFLSQALDDRYWFNNESKINIDELEVKYEKDSLYLPATLVTNKSTITVKVIGSEGSTIIDDWKIDKVDRQNVNDFSTFSVNYKSKSAKNIEYNAGDKVIVTVTPVNDTPDEAIDIVFSVNEKKRLMINFLEFERN